MTSIFADKNSQPDITALKAALGKTFSLWQELEAYTISLRPDAMGEWNYSGQKFGWSYRIKDSKRVLIYLLPRDRFFKVAFVFGQKATDSILESKIAATIKKELESAIIHAEGRGIRLAITDKKIVTDIKKLIATKLSF